MSTAVAPSGNTAQVTTQSAQAKVWEKPQTQKEKREHAASVKSFGHLFQERDREGSEVSKAMILLAYLSGNLLPSHWPSQASAGERYRSNCSDAKTFLLGVSYISSASKPDTELSQCIAECRIKNGPGHVRIFLQTGSKESWRTARNLI